MSRRGLSDGAHRQSNHGADIGDRRRQDECIGRFGQLPKLGDVLFRHAQLDSFLTARYLDRVCDFAQPLGGGLGNGEDGCGRSLCLVDLLLLLCLGRFDDLLFLTLGRLMAASRSPSDVRITARFSRSARICFSIASSTPFGG
jgi:hypothetical protein